MRLYLDTSALVKLYVEEEGSPLVRMVVAEAETVAISIIGYVEARAAFARRHRERSIPLPDYRRVIRDFESDWGRYLVLQASDTLIRRAGRLAEAHSLRAYDSIHLASAIILRQRLAEPLSFASWDSQLQAAARREGLDLVRIRET
ncbi:MAG: type II toxin-antitoxin system VapC family toxin [Deltaproteobacteria bacterium]|nr:type II toxin-antitoxin system VapC family toxin [Deltaproteobacteria bacterium]